MPYERFQSEAQRVLFSWWKARRRRRILKQPFPEEWEALLHSHCRHFNRLGSGDQQRLRRAVQLLVHEKHWEGCNGLQVNDEMRVTIAAHAALLGLGFDHPPFERLMSILIYPSTFVAQPHRRQPWGLLDESPEPRLGEAWYHGPVILSWAEIHQQCLTAPDGRNLVIHEFAHLLDMANADVDGIPLLKDDPDPNEWVDGFQTEFRRLQRQVQLRRKTVLDDYAATSLIEFFAVGSEAFFENSLRLQAESPKLYELLQRYYHQDPAQRWLPPG